MILVLQDGLLLRASDLDLPENDAVFGLLAPVVSRFEAHGGWERVRICHDHLHHAAEHGVLLPPHQANRLWVVGGEDKQENPAFPVELGDGEGGGLVAVRQLDVGRRAVSGDVEYGIEELPALDGG